MRMEVRRGIAIILLRKVVAPSHFMRCRSSPTLLVVTPGHRTPSPPSYPSIIAQRFDTHSPGTALALPSRIVVDLVVAHQEIPEVVMALAVVSHHPTAPTGSSPARGSQPSAATT